MIAVIVIDVVRFVNHLLLFFSLFDTWWPSDWDHKINCILHTYQKQIFNNIQVDWRRIAWYAAKVNK